MQKKTARAPSFPRMEREDASRSAAENRNDKKAAD